MMIGWTLQRMSVAIDASTSSVKFRAQWLIPPLKPQQKKSSRASKMPAGLPLLAQPLKEGRQRFIVRTIVLAVALSWNNTRPTHVRSAHTWRIFMSNSGRGCEQDSARVAGSQDHQIRYEAGKQGDAEDLVKGSIKESGNRRGGTETDLDRWK